MASAWTKELTEQLRVLWAEGKSASEVAHILGGGLTRCAVIGRIHRAGLQTEARKTLPLHANRPYGTKHAEKPAPKPPPPEPVAEFIGPLNDFPPSGRCKYPRGRMHTDFQCCGQATEHISESWCAYHRLLCFNTAETRRVNDRARAKPTWDEAA